MISYVISYFYVTAENYFLKTFSPSSPASEKIRSPLKIQKLQAHPIWQKLKNFQDPLQKGGEGGEDTVALGELDWNDPYA